MFNFLEACDDVPVCEWNQIKSKCYGKYKITGNMNKFIFIYVKYAIQCYCMVQNIAKKYLMDHELFQLD